MKKSFLSIGILLCSISTSFSTEIAGFKDVFGGASNNSICVSFDTSLYCNKILHWQ